MDLDKSIKQVVKRSHLNFFHLQVTTGYQMAVVICLISFSTQAQSLEGVMKNYFNAIGGESKVAQIEASKEVSYNWFQLKSSQTQDSSKSIKVETLQKEPYYKRFISFDAKGNWTNEFYYNEKGSTIAMGTFIKKDPTRRPVSLSITVDLWHWFKQGRLKYLGEEKLADKAYEVVIKVNADDTEFFYFNIDTHLLDAYGTKNLPYLTYYRNYTQTNLISQPFLLEKYDKEFLIYRQNTISFEFNPSISNDVFYFNEKEYEERSQPKQKYSSVMLNAPEHDLSSFILKNFPGRRVFVDLWATWCAPCKKEFRSYDSTYYSFMESKNINLVYLSIDKDADETKWKNDVIKLGLKGFHARANKLMVEDIKRQIFNSGVITIPRYILIDEQGKILSSNFPRPSDTDFGFKLEKCLSDLLYTK